MCKKIFLNKIKDEQNEFIQKCSIFISYKQQIHKSTNLKEKNDLKNQNERFIKEVFNGEFPEFINLMKEINDCKLFDTETQNDLRSLIIKFSFSQKFFLKLDKVFYSLEWEKNTSMK